MPDLRIDNRSDRAVAQEVGRVAFETWRQRVKSIIRWYELDSDNKQRWIDVALAVASALKEPV